jgi:hypothetical protein
MDQQKKPLRIDISMEDPSEEEPSDEEAAQSDDDVHMHDCTLKATRPTPTVTTATPTSATSSITTPSDILDPNSGEYLIQLTIELKPNKEHTDRLVEGVKDFLSFFQKEDKSACILPRISLPPTSPPKLINADAKDFPSDYLSINKYVKVTNAWLLSQPPVDKDTLRQRLTSYQTVQEKRGKKQKQRKSKTKSTGPTALYTLVKIHTTVPTTRIQEVIQGTEICLSRSKNIKVALKQLQCWDSSPKYALLGVNNGLDPAGVEDALLHHLKLIERKLCRSNKIPMLDYYDLDLPKIHVSSRRLRELSLPEEERKQLTFATFASHCQFVFHIEAGDEAWVRLEPLVDIFVRGNGIYRVFGPRAHLMPMPSNRPNITDTRVYQAKGRLGMGYNAATAIYDCGDVLNYDVEVKVKMQDIQELDSEGTPTGRVFTPAPPYKRTTLRKELTKITLNGERVFHAAIKTMSGPDGGISRVVVPYNPRSPTCQEIQTFAKHTLANLACFFYHWWTKEVKYHESTVKRLMTSFYFDRYAIADESTWDPHQKRAISQYATAADTWLDDNADLDPQHNMRDVVAYGTTDSERLSLLSQLNYKEARNFDDVQSGASAITGDDASSGASSGRSETTEERAMGKTLDLKLQLAKANSALAERDQALSKMQAQLDQLMQLQKLAVSSTNQLVESGPPASGGSQEP